MEFKQDNFAFVDVVSLIFLVILFIGNFFGLLYFTEGSFAISIAISTLVVVLYYAIIQVLKKSKQTIVTKRYKTPAMALFAIFIALAIGSLIPLTHVINIETNVKPKIQAEAADKIGKVTELSKIYENRAHTDLQNYEGELTNKLKVYIHTKQPFLKKQLSALPYNIDIQTLASPQFIDVDNLVASKLTAIRKKVQENQSEIDSVVDEAHKNLERFDSWSRLKVAAEYKKLNQFVWSSYELVNNKLADLPLNKEKIPLMMNPTQVPINQFFSLNKIYPPNWLLPIIAVVVIHLFILIPFFLYKVRVYVDNNPDENSKPKVIEY
ncbi:hypothetical protein [Capnocytophaga sp. oral taxon 878]|uniref:hypothetical protein n=1 Tax=Capnocytophaga sp. oral taxon 878 TaxID=1316596 RepID=UPI000D029312|nr:hypothetical protein [Capnocytophaga sp. oral taxon 878]AVM49432.1 hypothetical protein C4H12_02535 [Capnocytophaga sp. oral taxon 878]